jgi:hypothetical protein
MSNSPYFPLSTFPESPSIPPASFYNIQGLNTYLNQHPSFKQFFVFKIPYLYPSSYINELISTSQVPADSFYAGYDTNNVPISPVVVTLSQHQQLQYNQQIDIFRKVYTYNSNAYVNYRSTLYSNPNSKVSPIYYRFQTYSEYNNYKASVALINKLYPFDTMANGSTFINPSTLNWIVPFPL